MKIRMEPILELDQGWNGGAKMSKLKKRRGFSVGELLAVVAIMAVLAAVGVIAIVSYLRSMAKLEYDENAKELFIAAQNHMSMAESQGYLGREEEGFGLAESSFHGEGFTPEEGVYVFVVQKGDTFADTGSILNLILPPSSLDETVRSGGCYILRYHRDSGKVLDVFYWEEDDDTRNSHPRYAHQYKAEDYTKLMSDTSKKTLKNYGDDKAVIGYYGGAEAESIPKGKPLAPPSIQLINAEQLKVIVTDTNVGTDYQNALLNLEIIGKTSGAVKVVTLKPKDSDFNVEDDQTDVSKVVYTVILDDITQTGSHFCELFDGMIPGEDITVQAVAFNNVELTNIAYSPQLRGNSLFGNGSTVSNAGKAEVANFRHLENLDSGVSGVNVSAIEKADKARFTEAQQTQDLSWGGFWEDKSIYISTGGSTPEGYYQPVLPVNDGTFAYDGKGHSISAVKVNAGSGGAGLFDSLSGGSVKNLKLVDFEVSGADAGALAGSVSGTEVENVLALNGTTTMETTITGSGSVGGLIGEASGAKVTKCAAALIVSSAGGAAGGLIGTAANTELRASYSAGHTVNGDYAAYNVSIVDGDGNLAGTAGGLVGSATNSEFQYCYSTCSASGASAGGLVGSVSGGSFADCYAAGLVSGTSEGAFAGSSCTAERCWYFEIINERPADAGDLKKGYTYLPPTPGTSAGIAPLDADTVPGDEGFDTYYNTFVGAGSAWKNAMPYDVKLSQYYNRDGYMKYPLKTVTQLMGGLSTVTETDFVAVHYGDWPAPELWVRED